MKLNFWQIVGLALILVCGAIYLYRNISRPLPPPTPAPESPASATVTTAPTLP